MKNKIKGSFPFGCLCMNCQDKACKQAEKILMRLLTVVLENRVVLDKDFPWERRGKGRGKIKQEIG